MNKEELKQMIRDILAKGHTMSLGTFDSAGVWVADVTYVYDQNLTLYWMSSPMVRHSKAIETEPRAAATVTLSTEPKSPNLGIQFSGKVRLIETERLDLAKMHAAKRSAPAPDQDEGFLKGRRWYELKPDRFDIINESLWGFKKQTIEMGE